MITCYLPYFVILAFLGKSSYNKVSVVDYASLDIWATTWDFEQSGMCDQQMLRPACVYVHFDQSLCKCFDC